MNTVVEQNSKSNSTNQILDLDILRGIEDDIKERIKQMWKEGYSYVIICEYATNALGIQRASNILKAIAKVQSILDKINVDLNQLKKLLEELEGVGFPKTKWYYETKDGQWKISNEPFDPEGKIPSHHPKDWKRWAVPAEQMHFAIQAWLQQNNDLGIKGADGKTLNNAEAMQYIWKELYGPKCDNKGGLISELKLALQNPWYKQSDNGAAKTLEALNGDALYGSDGADAWTCDKGSKPTFLDFLRGGQYSYWGIADILEKAFTDSYYKNNNITPGPNSYVTVKDYVGDVTSQMDSVVQSSTAMNSTESSDMSMFAQQLTSLINIVQQMLQQNDKSNTTMTNNQIAR